MKRKDEFSQVKGSHKFCVSFSEQLCAKFNTLLHTLPKMLFAVPRNLGHKKCVFFLNFLLKMKQQQFGVLRDIRISSFGEMFKTPN